MKIIENTYPKKPLVYHARVGDIVHWERRKGRFWLIRDSDKATLFGTAQVDRDGNLRSNGKAPALSGIIGEVKSRGWKMVVG